MFHVKNDLVLIKYKIKSSKPHSYLLLTLSPFSPDTLSLSVGMTSVYGTLLWILWLLFVKHFCVTCYICLACIIVCGSFCLLSICLGFFFFLVLYIFVLLFWLHKFYISLTLIVILLWLLVVN